MKSFVTGIAGFAGNHLARLLIEEGFSVGGLVHAADRIERAATLPTGVELFEADVLDGPAVAEALARFRPAAVYHLAAFSNPESSREQSRKALETNILGAHGVLEGALALEPPPRVLLVGSCQQYGEVPEAEQPIEEDRPPLPLTPYAVSKASQEILGIRYFLSEKIPVLLVRSFNHTGPGQAPSYVCSSLARQITEIEIGRREPRLRVGNLAARRDFSDVRDVVRAYRAIADRGEPLRPYNVCSGRAVSIQEILERLLALSGAKVSIETDPSRYHARDVPLILGDSRRLRSELGWAPRFDLGETLRDLLDYWRRELTGQ